ncbi:MAG: radical SAM protein [Crenarchaeota archaeon]|nr:radical SAM protein [Thermoproteota archaeon]
MSLRIGEWVVSSSSRAPRALVLELTTSCNLSCAHCFRRAVGIEGRHAPLDMVELVAEQCRELGIERVTLSGWGEPTTYPRFLDAVWMLRDAGVEVAVNTNGIALARIASELVEARVSEVILSVDAFSPETYSAIRGARLEAVEEGLDQLRNERESRGCRRPRVVTHFVVTRLNVGELRNFPEFAKRFAVSKLEISHLVPLNRFMERELACFSDPSCIEELERVSSEISKYMFSHYYEITIPRSRPSVERRCPYAAKQAAFVRVDGAVAPCIFYAHPSTHSFNFVERRVNPVIFGRVDEGLDRVWTKPSYIEFRARAALSIMPSCLDCHLAPYCEPTRSNEKDCWGNSPTCSHCPYSHRLATCPL